MPQYFHTNSVHSGRDRDCVLWIDDFLSCLICFFVRVWTWDLPFSRYMSYHLNSPSFIVFTYQLRLFFFSCYTNRGRTQKLLSSLVNPRYAFFSGSQNPVEVEIHGWEWTFLLINITDDGKRCACCPRMMSVVDSLKEVNTRKGNN